jgi:hypothetical protein
MKSPLALFAPQGKEEKCMILVLALGQMLSSLCVKISRVSDYPQKIYNPDPQPFLKNKEVLGPLPNCDNVLRLLSVSHSSLSC